MSQNTFGPMSDDLRNQAESVCAYLEASGHTIIYDPAARAFHFKKDFKEMTISVVLIEQEKWADIRQTFRAVFQPGPQVENFGATNEWSRWPK